MKKMLILSCLSLAVMSVMSCNKEPDVAPVSGKQITLSVGFEDQVSVDAPHQAATKTYLKNQSAIEWGSNGADKIIYVFDSKGKKNAFDAPTDAPTSATRSFTGTISEGSEIAYVIWTGSSASYDKCTISDGVISGSSLVVKNPQTVNNANSFDNGANVAIMKPGDTALRNVFGYIKYTVPVIEGGTTGAIKSVTFSAAEPLAGAVEVDYAGTDPVATVVGNGSKSLTVNTRVRNGLEAGTYYAVLPVGTYTDFKITVTLPDDTSFDLPVSDPVTIVRGKYTTAGTLPVEDPNASEEPEPEDPGESVVWPNDATAFDYGLNSGASRIHKMQDYATMIADKTSLDPNNPITFDGVTFCGNESQFYVNPRFVTGRAKLFDTIAGVKIPTTATQNFFFKVNRPGAVSVFPRYGIKNGAMTTSNITVAIVTVKGEVKAAKYVFDAMPTNPTSDEKKTDPDCQITAEITEADLNGITEPATVYIFHTGAANISYYPITWTSAN